MEYGIRVEEVMTRNPVMIDEKASVEKAAKLMSKQKIGSLIVVGRKKELKGIVTQTDIISKVVARGKDPKKVKVSDIMSKRPVHVEVGSDLSRVVELIREKGYTKFPITNKGKVVGFITEKDLLFVAPSLIETLTEMLNVRQPIRKLRYRKLIE